MRKMKLVLALTASAFLLTAYGEKPALAESVNLQTNKETGAADIERKQAYSDILRHPDLYVGYYAITKNIPSDRKDYVQDIDHTEPYYFAVQDINNDGIDELLLGYGLHYEAPRILLNILQYDAEQKRIIDVDGERTYPLMDDLHFYSTGYYTTQNGAGGLYTECWNLKDNPNHYWYGYERGGDFEDTDGKKFTLAEYYNMIGDEIIPVQWYEVTEKNIQAYEEGFFILPDSDRRVYTKKELSGLSKDQLRLARNEIFARKGRKFTSADLQAYFSAKPWYKPQYDPDEFNRLGDGIFNKFELENLKLIEEVESQSR